MLSYTSSKVHYSVGENIYMLPSDMNLNIKSGTVGCNNKILVPDGKFSLGRNDKVNSLVLEPIISKEAMPKVTKIKNHKVVAQAHELSQNQLSLTKRKELL